MQPEQPALVEPTPLSPEAYNAVIEQLSPQDVRLADLVFHVRAPVHSGPLMASAEMGMPERQRSTSAGDGAVFVDIEHQAVFRIASTDGSIAADGAARYVVRLRLGFEPPEGFWPLFLTRNVKLYTHPALRDLLASLAARASLVALPLASVAITQAVSKAQPGFTMVAEAKKPYPS